MENYLFILGRDPELSLVEIASYFEARKQPYIIKSYTNNYALIETMRLDPAKVIEQLGGTTKIAKIIEELEELY